MRLDVVRNYTGRRQTAVVPHLPSAANSTKVLIRLEVRPTFAAEGHEAK